MMLSTAAVTALIQHETPVTEVLGVLAAILLGAKALGEVAERLGQPAVLGEMLAGVILGPSLLGVVDPSSEIIHIMAEVGVVVLLFSIGLETELKKLLEPSRLRSTPRQERPFRSTPNGRRSSSLRPKSAAAATLTM